MNQRQWIPISESPADNVRRMMQINTSSVAVVFCVFLIAGIVVSQLVVGVVVGVLVAAALFVQLKRSADASLLNQLDFVAVDEHNHARVINVVDGLCVVSGDRRPAVYVMREKFPVALAVASPGQQGSIVVSDGLLETMDRVETEAVMAHVLWRLRTGNIALTCYFIRLFSVLRALGAARLGTYLVKRFSDEKILMWADISACQATRYPPALISALQKCNRAHQLEIAPIFGPLMFVDPKTVGDDTPVASQVTILGTSAVSVTERIAVLKEM